MEQGPADNNLLNALNLVPNQKPLTEVTSPSEPPPSDVNGEHEA